MSFNPNKICTIWENLQSSFERSNAQSRLDYLKHISGYKESTRENKLYLLISAIHYNSSNFDTEIQEKLNRCIENIVTADHILMKPNLLEEDLTKLFTGRNSNQPAEESMTEEDIEKIDSFIKELPSLLTPLAAAYKKIQLPLAEFLTRFHTFQPVSAIYKGFGRCFTVQSDEIMGITLLSSPLEIKEYFATHRADDDLVQKIVRYWEKYKDTAIDHILLLDSINYDYVDGIRGGKKVAIRIKGFDKPIKYSVKSLNGTKYSYYLDGNTVVLFAP